MTAVDPGQELVYFAVRMTIRDPGQDVGEIGKQVDIVALAGLDKGGDDSPVFGVTKYFPCILSRLLSVRSHRMSPSNPKVIGPP